MAHDQDAADLLAENEAMRQHVGMLKQRLREVCALMRHDISEGKVTPTETRVALLSECADISPFSNQ